MVKFFDKFIFFNFEFLKKLSVEKANGLSFVSPIQKVEIAQKNGLDVFHEDGKHLNEMGNKIYGEELGKKLLEILN